MFFGVMVFWPQLSRISKYCIKRYNWCTRTKLARFIYHLNVLYTCQIGTVDFGSILGLFWGTISSWIHVRSLSLALYLDGDLGTTVIEPVGHYLAIFTTRQFCTRQGY